MNMSRDVLAAALQEAEDKKLRYYQIECAKCRHAIKVPLKQMRHYAPHEAEEAGSEGES
jgi:RNA polymerase-interacting CarD/CdnL/TRCF family regulator